MKRKLDPFKLGLFVLCGAAIVIGGLLWIGATQILEKTKTYVTYFDKSIGGLNTGSSVKHLGIKIGRISSISLVRHDTLVRVEIKLKPDFEVKKDEAAVLEMAGITGGDYLSITKAPANIETVTPKIDFPTEHPLIPSAPGKIATLESSVEGLGSQSARV